MKKYLADKEIRFYIINATQIAVDIGLGSRTNTIMQSAFFKIADVIPYELAVEQMKKAIRKSFGNKGEEIVNMNNAAVDKGGEVIEVKIPAEWKNIKADSSKAKVKGPDFVADVCHPVNHLKGDDLPVSAFVGREDGTFPAGTTAFEKRGIAVDVPEWIPENCIQCNQCSFVCPHAAIRPFLVNGKEKKALPEGIVTQPMKGKDFEGYDFRIQVSVLDCTGCGNCADVCPSKEKALVMKPLETQLDEVARFDYLDSNVSYKEDVVDKEKTVKNSQFAQPLFEFSGACAGCGETPYVKTITQLYGERMMIANATGCSSIYGGSAPSTPYCKHKQSGHGPAWANSLFEDNAEYGFGMAVGVRKMRDRIADRLQKLAPSADAKLKEAIDEWLSGRDDAKASKIATAKLLPMLKKVKDPLATELLNLEQYFVKKSVWVFGGDGWAYDIGYGGLDHVIASGEDINILVMDTEVYSNTGGQSSKSTPVGAVAKFAASGKKIRKKDLGMMAMSYGYVYVAQVAMGASQSQFFKALKEAEAYPGPSLIIAYSPCINHGLRRGMGKSQNEMKHAVESGYWQMYRYNPQLEEEGKNPFTLDSKEPDWSLFNEFINGEVRYTSLKKAFPKEAVRLQALALQNARWRYNSYKRLAEMKFEDA